MTRSRLLALSAVLLILPLGAACWWLGANDRFGPVFERAIIEIRVRDVGTMSTPLIGITGRLGESEAGIQSASHPGPLPFYALAPGYRLLGASYWALRASTLILHAAAIVLALFIARRRAGTAGVIGVAFGLSVLELGYGLITLTEPYNPYLPTLWFVVFLVGVWSVACDDVRMLSIIGVTGSFCAQAHVAYVAVCGGLGLFSLALVAASGVRARRKGGDAREHARACLLAALWTLVLWIPPLIDQSIHEPGNLAMLADYFLHSKEPSLGFEPALKLLMSEIDPWHLTVNQFRDPGSLRLFLHPLQPKPELGGLLVVWWMVAVIAAATLANRALLALHATLAAGLVVAWLSMSRIIGPPWPYLLLWASAIGIFMFVSIVATAAVAVWKRLDASWRARSARLCAVGLAATAAFCVRLLAETKTSGSTAPTLSMQVRALSEQIASMLGRHDNGEDARPHLLSWSDVPLAGVGLGLLDELQGRGLNVRVAAEMRTFLPDHCVIDANAAGARLHIVSGDWIGDFRSMGAKQVAFSDPRSVPEREEFERLRNGVIRILHERAREDLVAKVGRNLIEVQAQVPNPIVLLAIRRMVEIGEPAAVFLVPVAQQSVGRSNR
jgi:hypothetical protein